MQLATRVAFHDHLLPVCLPPQGMKELDENMQCTVIGWGKKQSCEWKNIILSTSAILFFLIEEFCFDFWISSWLFQVFS